MLNLLEVCKKFLFYSGCAWSRVLLGDIVSSVRCACIFFLAWVFLWAYFSSCSLTNNVGASYESWSKHRMETGGKPLMKWDLYPEKSEDGSPTAGWPTGQHLCPVKTLYGLFFNVTTCIGPLFPHLSRRPMPRSRTHLLTENWLKKLVFNDQKLQIKR